MTRVGGVRHAAHTFNQVFGTRNRSVGTFPPARGCGSDATTRQSRRDHQKRPVHAKIPGAHITLRAQAALGAKLSLAAASSGEPVYTRRIEVLFKLLRYAVDETADRDLGGGRPSKGHATAAHRVCIFLGTSLFFLLLLY